MITLCAALAAAPSQADALHECTGGGWQLTFREFSGPDGAQRSLRVAYLGAVLAEYGNDQIIETPTPLGRLQSVTGLQAAGLNTLLVPQTVLFDSTPVAYGTWSFETVTPPPGDPVRQRNRTLRMACTVRFDVPELAAR